MGRPQNDGVPLFNINDPTTHVTAIDRQRRRSPALERYGNGPFYAHRAVTPRVTGESTSALHPVTVGSTHADLRDTSPALGLHHHINAYDTLSRPSSVVSSSSYNRCSVLNHRYASSFPPASQDNQLHSRAHRRSIAYPSLRVWVSSCPVYARASPELHLRVS